MSVQAANGTMRQAEVPIQKEKDPKVLAVASFLRNHKALKLRQGSINGQTVDFFRFKRCIRALTSQDFQDKQRKYNLPVAPELLGNPAAAQQLFVGLIANQLVVPVKKLSTRSAREHGFKPTRESPCLEPSTKCVLAADEYFYWTFTPPNPYLPLYSLLGIVGILTLICFPLWPLFMRRGAWYVSMAALALIGAIFVIAIVRLVVFVALSPFTKFWLFPNLFADVGFVESFIPLYAFEKPKASKSKSAVSTSAAAPPPATTSSTGVSASSTSATKRKVTLEEVQD